MNNIESDIIESNFIDIADASFNSVDALILAAISYVPFHKIVKGDLWRVYDRDELLEEIAHFKANNKSKGEKRDVDLLNSFLCSYRYRDFRIGYYCRKDAPELEQQFSAITFLNDKCAYVVYTGTEPTVLGWQEDFLLTMQDEILSKDDAFRYLRDISSIETDKKLVLAGHSKGGMLAIYAAKAFRDKDRIRRIYCFDSPGFRPDFFDTQYKNIASKIHKYVPKASIVGQLLNDVSKQTIVDAYSISIAQHSTFNWRVEKHKFVYRKKVDKHSLNVAKALNGFAYDLSYGEKRIWIDTVSGFLSKMNVDDLRDPDLDGKKAFSIVRSIKPNMDMLGEERKAVLKRTSINLLKAFFFALKPNKTK